MVRTSTTLLPLDRLVNRYSFATATCFCELIYSELLLIQTAAFGFRILYAMAWHPYFMLMCPYILPGQLDTSSSTNIVWIH